MPLSQDPQEAARDHRRWTSTLYQPGRAVSNGDSVFSLGTEEKDT